MKPDQATDTIHAPLPAGIFTSEAIGDWSGLKGTFYHLLGGVFLVLQGRTIAFYAGNDLLAAPPPEVGPDDEVGLRAGSSAQDEWIQFKNVDERQTWTLHRILHDERLLLNFILNALQSRREGKPWTVFLATPTRVDGQEIRKFIAPKTIQPRKRSKGSQDQDSAAPARDPQREAEERKRLEKLEARFTSIVQEAVDLWAEHASLGDAPVSTEEVCEIGKEILTQLANTRPTPVRAFTDAIEKELLKLYPADTANQVILAMQGALLEVGNAPTAEPIRFDLAWLEGQTGYALAPRDLLRKDTAQACDRQVERARPSDWSPSQHVARRDLEEALREFRGSQGALFVLVGDSGAGKSWACTADATVELQGRVRVLLEGAALTGSQSLVSIIATVFRDMAAPNATDEAIFQRLRGTAANPQRGPLLLFADDLPLTADPAAFEQRLVSLCREARDRGVKLVLVARQSIWQRLCRQDLLKPFLFQRTRALTEPRSFSYQLTHLTEDEMEQLLRVRLAHAIDIDRVILAIRRPEFAALRNPYLFSLFIQQRLSGAAPGVLEPPSIDALLDEEIRSRFDRIARRIGCEPHEMDAARLALVEEMWKTRRDGCSSAGLVKLLDREIPQFGRAALQALQAEDILTPTGDTPLGARGNVTYANPQFGELLTAYWLAERLQAGEDILSEMEPGLDDGVITAMARGAVDEAVDDGVLWAEEVQRRDEGWLSALATGLAQRSGDGWRIPALLTAWARCRYPEIPYGVLHPLGRMAARSSCARAWIAALYADEDRQQHMHGEIAVGAALEVVPRWVERRIRLRLRREIARQPSTSTESERRFRNIRSALRPLQQVNHARAAAVARSLLRWIEAQPLTRYRQHYVDVREQFTSVTDVVRGRIALFGTEEDLAAIVSDLRSEDPSVRASAARALLPLTQERPEQVKEVVLNAAATEREVTTPFLDLLYGYVDRDPQAVVEAVASSGVLSTERSGIALVVLARAAAHVPEQVRSLLPERLDAEPEVRAILSDPLAYAWWQYAAATPSDQHARGILERLSVPEREEVSDKWRVFAVWGAALALLGRIALDIPAMAEAARNIEILYHHLALETNWGFVYTDPDTLCTDFASEIAAHPLFGRLCRTLVEAAQEYAFHEMHPIEAPYSEWQFRVANLAVDCLSLLAPEFENPDGMIADLPADWPALRTATALLRAGRADEAVIRRACEICAAHANVLAGNVQAFRDRFILDLRAAGRVPVEFLELAERIAAGSDYGVVGMTAEAAAQPEALLDLLHAKVTFRDAVPFLWGWSPTPTEWCGALVGHVFRAAFDRTPLSLCRSRRLCDQMLEALRALPATPRVREWQVVYETVRAFADGKPCAIPEVDFGEDLLSQSHAVALRVVQAYQEPMRRPDRSLLETLISSGEGWVMDGYHWIQDGVLVTGTGHSGEVYFPPALRIALTVASARSGCEDFARMWTSEREAVYNRLRQGSLGRVLRGRHRYAPGKNREDLLQDSLEEANDLQQLFPRDARVHWARGHVLLLRGDLEEALTALQECLRLPSFRVSLHASARYDLACVYARQGKHSLCRELLTEAIQSYPEYRDGLGEDEDLTTVRNEDWFQALSRNER